MENTFVANRKRAKLPKITLIISFFVFGILSTYVNASSSYAQIKNLTIKLENRSVRDVFDYIEKNSEFVFLYYENMLDTKRKVSINIENQPVTNVLNKVFEGTNLTYEIEDRQIVITEKTSKAVASVTPQQQSKVKGKVIDDLGEPLPGVAIVVAGSTRGVTTDLDGSFEIEVRASDKLTFSYLGMADQLIQVGNQKMITVKMAPKADELQEVTVVAFGKQKKESVIGAITSVSINDLKIPVSKISSSLAGQMAGVVAVQRTGEPGEGAEFWIRGVNTFGSNNRPLVLVDGIERALDLVDPEDIETFSILKDATATAVYGVRGANGVILITTRKGTESSKPTINVRIEQGFLSPTKMPEMADALQFMTLYNDVYKEVNQGRLFYTEEVMAKHLSGDDPDLYPNVNWMKEIYKDMTTNQRVNVNITGGSTKVRYFVAGSFYNENGIYNAVKGDEYNPSLKWRRFNFRSNIDINLHPTTVLNINLSNQYDIKNRPDVRDLWTWTFVTVPVIIPMEYSDGKIAAPTIGENPYNKLNKTGYIQEFKNNAQSLVGLSQDFSELITKGLKANVKFSWDAVNNTDLARVKNPSTYFATGRDEKGNLIFTKNNDGSDYITFWKGNSGGRTIYLEASATYENVFAEKHRLGGLFLFNMRDYTNNFPDGYITSLPYRHQGVAARATYSFMDKYFIEGNFGYNGSENFSPGKRFGFFPSAALGYLISNESFFRPLSSVLSLLKLKGSYGIIGNDQIGGSRRFAFNSEMTETGGFLFGDAGQNWIGGIATGYPGNSNVSWEKAIKMNLGIEFELFHALKFQVDYFQEKREGIFIERRSVPSVVGININPYVNLGKMENKGIDISMELNKRVGEVTLSGRGNFTFNRNKKLYDDNPPPVMEYQNVIGMPLNQQFGLEYIGYFESEEDIMNSPVQKFGKVRPGDRKYRDINADGVVDSYDLVAIGRTEVPEINYGFGASLNWKGIDCSLFFQGIDNVTAFIGGSTVDGFEAATLGMQGVHKSVAMDRWTEENPNKNAAFPRLALTVSQNNKQLSTANQRDMSFIRLKNAEIGYSFPRKMIRKIGLSTLRFYVQGNNLLTFSKFKMWDPEAGRGNVRQGDVYPNMRVMNVGMNINF